MSFQHRIQTIYWKELIDILRDRRTLLAMIVVPIVMYPLLLLGSIQAVSYQAEQLDDETVIVGVINEQQGKALQRLLYMDDRIPNRQAGSEGERRPVHELVEVRAFGSEDNVVQHVQQRSIQLGFFLDSDELADGWDVQNHVRLAADLEDIRSRAAEKSMRDLIERIGQWNVAQRKIRANLPPAFDMPFDVTTQDLSSPPSVLGQVLPLILILMTITGAIYPAIDLTAGERERGTLESLMVTPVPVIDLIVGKFLVVTTVAIIGAALNLGCVSATVYFGGFDVIISQAGGGLGIGKIVFILLCLIPFAVLMSAIMLAVCSYARSFKEAQNYVTPVILAVLIPGGIAALPATRLEGIMLVMPVGNMVLLSRDVLMGAVVPAESVATVVLSTTLYAAAAVGIAASVFGQESVAFSDAGSLKTIFSRRLIRPDTFPTVATSLLVVAVLFPVWYFIQTALSREGSGGAAGVLYGTARWMPLLFVGLPLGVLMYWKRDVAASLRLRIPAARHVVAAALMGLSAWVPTYELHALQIGLLGAPASMLEHAERLSQALQELPPVIVVLVLAVMPAFCEEILFRGFLLSGLASRSGKWTAIATTAVIFAAYHFLLFKFAVTMVLGMALGLLCWQSGSLLPCILMHLLHNGVSVLTAIYPELNAWMGIVPPEQAGETATPTWAHLPVQIIFMGTAAFFVGVMLTAGSAHKNGAATGTERAEPIASDDQPSPVPSRY